MSELLDTLVSDFSIDRFSNVIRKLSPDFVPKREVLHVSEENFVSAETLGVLDFSSEGRRLVVAAISVQGGVNERRGRKQQYDLAKKLLRSMPDRDSGLFVFYDSNGRFRLSFVHEMLSGSRRRYSSYRRFTFFVDKDYVNKTFIRQLSGGDFSKFSGVQAAFSVAAVSHDFYSEFLTHFDAMEKDIFAKAELKKADDGAKDFALLFAIRIIFLGFVQKRGWLADDQDFLSNFHKEYHASQSSRKAAADTFYVRWLKPLFHEALNSAPGRQVSYQNNEWSDEWAKRLQMLPWLDGGLFQERALDKHGYALSDKTVEGFFEFLFSYNFTIEENTLDDNELGLNPEFLGIIFERLINKENGAVYTPRTEVDFMCRMALVRWLLNKLGGSIEKEQLYNLFFKERDTEHQSEGKFTDDQAEQLLELLRNVAICDPAVGSGAFPVGMLHVLEEIQLSLLQKLGRESEAADRFVLRKNIIFSSLHGIDVAEWAVWICQLRLWITLFIDAPDALRVDLDPILPALDFKMRVGDSLVQHVGTKLFPVEGYPAGGRAMQNKIRELKKLKRDYFDKPHTDRLRLQHQETLLYASIIGAEIKEKEADLDRVLGGRVAGTQSQIFIGKNASEQVTQNHLFEEEIAALEAQVAMLRGMSDSLLKDRPLVWGIEFADIFSERGGFDVVIGNPPYIRQESIGDPLGNLTKAKYKAALKEMVGLDFQNWDKKVDGKSDLYTYFYIHGLKLLNKDGVHTFICSNSWLDVGYGTWLQQFLLEKAPLEYIFDNHAKRSFADADVNTIISVISAPRKAVDNKHITRFVAFKKPYEEVVLTEVLLAVESSDSVTTTEDFRSYPISNDKLLEVGLEEVAGKSEQKILREYVGEKWGGKYLRAPDLVLQILKSPKLKNLSHFVDINYGVKPGNVQFFFLDAERAKAFNIEKKYLKPATISSRHIDSLFIKPSHYIFDCKTSKKDLAGTGALEYILWGESEELNSGVSVLGHKPYWYSLELPNVDVLLFRFWDKRFFTPIALERNMTCSDNFCYGKLLGKEWQVKLLLNSTFYFLQIELFGNSNQGQGVLTTYMGHDYPFIRLPEISTDSDRCRVLLKNLGERDIKTIFEECGIDPESPVEIEKQTPSPAADRAAIDAVIFEALSLSEEQRADIYRSICRLVWNRVHRADSV